VAIIGVTATVIPVMISSIASQITNVPAVEIEIVPREDNRGAEITLTNNGSAPATNLTIFVIAPENITNATENFSTVGSLSINSSGARLEAGVPKLVHGSGSIVKLDISTGQNQSSGAYIVYVTYDQGSNMRKYPTSYSADLANGLANGAHRFFELLFNPIGFVSLLAAALMYTFFFLRYARHKRRKALARMAIQQIIEDITEVRRVLSDGNESTEELLFHEKESPEARRNRAIAFRYMIPHIRKENPDDFMIIDDFYRKVRERNQNVSKDLHPTKLQAFNNDCLEQAKIAWKKIDWDKYDILEVRADF
jgi:hypothetical protein